MALTEPALQARKPRDRDYKVTDATVRKREWFLAISGDGLSGVAQEAGWLARAGHRSALPSLA